jgi:hypothetical protein
MNLSNLIKIIALGAAAIVSQNAIAFTSGGNITVCNKSDQKMNISIKDIYNMENIGDWPSSIGAKNCTPKIHFEAYRGGQFNLYVNSYGYTGDNYTGTIYLEPVPVSPNTPAGLYKTLVKFKTLGGEGISWNLQNEGFIDSQQPSWNSATLNLEAK